jgi:hypothetical protein
MPERVGRIRRRMTGVAVCLLSALVATGPSLATEVIVDLRAGKDFQGTIRAATYDQRGIAWVATKYQLFKVENGRARLVDSAGDNRRLAMAPGGYRYAWLDSRAAAFGQFDLKLHAMDKPAKEIEFSTAKGPAPGFGSLYFSTQGRLIVGVRALQDLEGVRGEFGYAFLSGDGLQRNEVIREGLRNAVLDESGEAVLLLGDSNTESFRSDGVRLWQVSGAYVGAAVANGGHVALLHPSGRSAGVHLVRRGVVTRLKIPGRIRSMAITPDGTRGVVAVEDGKASLIDIDRCTADDCRVRMLPSLPVLSSHEISDVRFVDRNSIAFGAILALGLPPGAHYYGGTIVVLEVPSNRTYQHYIDIPLPATSGPKLDVTFGRREFTAFSPIRALVVRVEP